MDKVIFDDNAFFKLYLSNLRYANVTEVFTTLYDLCHSSNIKGLSHKIEMGYVQYEWIEQIFWNAAEVISNSLVNCQKMFDVTIIDNLLKMIFIWSQRLLSTL